jgi:MFS family permease
MVEIADDTVSGNLVAPPANGAETYAFGSARYAWAVTLILAGLQIVSNMERQILTLVVEPLRQDFHIQDVDVSLLQGLAFALFYSVVAVPVGWLADRWRRNRIIMVGMGLWSISTLGCMIAQSFAGLFAARLMIGLADASLVPASLSILSDYFPQSKLAGPVGTVTGASFLGSGLSLTFGGILLAVLPVNRSLALPVVGNIHGWQLTFGIMCLLGLSMLVLLLVVREPPRRDSAETARRSIQTARFVDVLRYLAQHMSYLGSVIGGLILLATYQYGVSSWVVTLFIRAHNWSAPQIGFLYGILLMVLGSAASFLGGRLCDWLRARGHRDANCLVPLGGVILLVPLSVTFALTGSAELAVVLLGAITFCAVICFGPAMAAVAAYTPSRMRAQMVAVTMLLSTLIGAGGGPWLVAVFTQDVFGHSQALPSSLSICSVLLLVPTAACFWLGGKTARSGQLRDDS